MNLGEIIILADPLEDADGDAREVEQRAFVIEGRHYGERLDRTLATLVPEAAVALKQGAGRLIRRESDQGVLAVCDTRLTTMGYGRRLLAALPPMRKLQSREEWLDALDALTRTSTTAPASP